MPTRTTFALVLVLSVVGAAVAGPKGAPRYRFRAGEKFAYMVETTTQIETTGPNLRNTATMSQLIDLTWEVGRVDGDGKATITQTIERIRCKAVTPNSTLTHDTKKPQGGGASAGADNDSRRKIVERLNGVVGARLSASVDPQGRIDDIRLIGGVSNFSYWEGVGNPASEAGFRRLMGQLIPLLPENVAASGDSWSVKGQESVAGGKTITETRYTCNGTEERDGRSLQKLSLAVTRTTENESGEVVGTSNGSGSVYLDTAAGRLIESRLTHTREQEIAVPDAKVTKKVTETITLKLAD